MKDKPDNNQKMGKWLNRNVTAMGFTSLFSDMSHEMATSILAQFITIELGGSAAFLGFIEGLSDFSSSFVKMYSGWFSDKIGKRKPLGILGYIMTGILIPTFAMATSWIHVLISRTLGWLGRGIREAPRDALLADSVEPGSYGHAFGFHRMMDTLGAIIGPSIAFLLLPVIGFRNVFWVSLIPGILSILVFAVFTREVLSRRKSEKRKLWSDIKGLPKRFRLFLLAAGVYGIGNFANTFLVLKTTEALMPTLGIIEASRLGTLLYIFLNVGSAIFAYVFGALGDRFNKRILLALGYLIFSVYCIGFIVLSPGVLTYAVLFLLAGVETGAIDSTARAYASELLGESERGTGFGVMSTVDGVGDFMSSAVAGILWTLSSSTLSFAYGAVFGLAATGILFVLNASSS
jgi:MFS family permease